MPEAKTKIIAGHEFTISQPYEAGHTLTEVEAKVLNQVRSENIANNMRKAVKDAEAAGTLDEVRAKVAEYDAEYTFAMPSAGGSKRIVDPVEREARKLAREAIRAQLAKETPPRKLKDVDPEKLEAAIEFVASKEEILKLARKAVKDRETAGAAADELDLG